MVFSSLTFLQCFLPLCLLAYFLVPKAWRNGVLFLFSLLFYAWGEPVYVVLMLFSTALDYTCGQMVERHRGQRGAKIALLVSVCVNLGLLGVFKYSDFLIGTVNSLFGTALPQPNLPLPIGISFYTFQTMSYTIDVYRGEARAQKNIINFGAYVTLFPQLIAGPIVRYQTVADELEHRDCTADLFADGVKRFACGIGKKVLLANNIGLLWEAASAQAAPTVLTAWLGVIAYGFQIYFDFSGYSDMAIGLGRMLGFRFLENFNYPFLADSITDFWRRWHISMGTWFRLYPAGRQQGRPCKAAPQYCYRLAADGLLARGKLELCSVGRVFWRAAGAGKADPIALAQKAARRIAAYLRAGAGNDQLDTLCVHRDQQRSRVVQGHALRRAVRQQ